jgi:hypothetical protein
VGRRFAAWGRAFGAAGSSLRVIDRPHPGSYNASMAKLKSEIEVECPCCRSMLVVDINLGRVVRHQEPERADKPELSEAQKILAAAEARREAMFQQSMEAEKGRDDALARRFEEALKQAHTEPITKPVRDFDLD